MTIKPGDLCFFIGSPQSIPWRRLAVKLARDRIVRVVRRDAEGMWRFEQPLHVVGRVFGVFKMDRWITAAVDKCLRPITPGDGEDEMLRIAGKPNETPLDVVRAGANA